LTLHSDQIRHNTPRGNAVLWAAAALAIGHALLISDGIYNERALAWIAAGTMLTWAGFFARPKAGALAYILMAAGLLWQIGQLFSRPPMDGATAPRALKWLGLGLMAGAIVLRGRGRAICLGGLLAGFFIYGVWLLRVTPAPHIDVYEVTRSACAAMAEGRNPYAIDFADIYIDRPDWERAFYPPGYVYGGRVHFGYQYMPLSLLVALAGHWFGGDYRLGNLAALGMAGALIGFARAGWLTAAAAALLVTMPRAYWVIQNGWAEPVVVLCMALVVFCAMRGAGGLPYAAGLLLASKQHMLLAAPALLLVMRKPNEWLKAAATAVVVTLPLVLWDARAFWHSAVEVQIVNPFRFDSLNFAAAWTRLGHAPPPGAISFLLGIAAAGVVAWRGRRSPAAFAGGVGVIYLTFFALSKQTFCNYYFLAAGALCCGVAGEAAENAEGVEAAEEAGADMSKKL
jgi:hypothetical protein